MNFNFDIQILGIKVSNNLKFKDNTDYITEKARLRIWTLRKLLQKGFNEQFVIDVYMKEIRSILEYGVPVWNGAITKKDSLKIEKVQKIVLRLLLKEEYSSYTDACKYFNLDKLHVRRENLCIRFARKEYAKPENGIFLKSQSKSKRIASKKLVVEPRARTARYYKSSIPYLSRLLNANGTE